MPLLHHRLLLVTTLLITSTTTLSISCPVELTVISHPPASLRLPSPTPVFGEGGGGGPFCTRVHLRGRPSRLRDPSRFFYALRVHANATRPNALELCFHRNATVGPCKCAASQWQKMPKSGLWAQAISPYDHRDLDFRMPADPSRSIVVSTEEEFLLHRVVFLVLGMVLMAVAHMLSESVVFYYGGAMTIGIFLVILIILFQDDTNVSLGAFMDTLVVLPDDLVQVIAKDFSLPTKDVCRTPDCDVVAASGSVKPQTSHVKDPKTSRTQNASPLNYFCQRQAEKFSRRGQEGDISIGKNAPMNCNATNCGSPTGHVVTHLSWNGISSSATVGSKDGNVTNSVLTTPTTASDVKTSQPANNSATKIVMSSKATAKESKLNPCAKDFSPSFASSRPVLAGAPPVNSNYISNSVTEVPTGVPVFEANSMPGGSSLSSKIMGHNVARLDPARIGTPYHPMQVGPTYISASPQPVVGGKLSPVVYVHPVSQDAMHGTRVISQGWSRPVLLNSYQARLQKFQGTAPVYVAPLVMATGNLPLVVQSPAPLVQPFQAIRPIMSTAASGIVPGKYM